MTRRPMKLFSPKYPTKIGTWNVRTLYQSGKSLQTAKEMDRYSIEILGLSEVRWNTSGMTTLNTGHTIIYSGNKNATDTHDKGVGFMLTKKAKLSLLEWNPVSSRIITARFDTKFQKTTIIQVYSPTNNADEEEKDDFYNSLQTIVNSVPKRDILMILGDLNAKVDPKVVQDYHILLQNKFGVLENLHDEETSINTAWEMTRDSIVQACEETVGYLQQNRKQWMSENTWKIVNERIQVKEKVLTAITRQQKKKKSCKQDKRNFVEKLAKEADTLYNITKQLSGKPPTSNTPIKDKDNNILTKLEDQLERWKEHFEQVLNRPRPTDPPELQNCPILNIKTSKIT
ncbi:unnamed protein product [Mytilus edulis]|uniref:Endonuclease/exonuclease/phosphatase domain-containing protein n=1 Tax=Mytilus edulis TaxID=6550 RepID=A0A8S3Q3U1_MYTED|nr:unnamed protein product [Mytilus edulis]